MSWPHFSTQGELFSTAGLSGNLFPETDRYRLFAALSEHDTRWFASPTKDDVADYPYRTCSRGCAILPLCDPGCTDLPATESRNQLG